MMNDFGKDNVQKWMEDEEAVSRIREFITMGGEAFFEEVRSHLSARELEDYLLDNPDERRYLKNSKKKQ